MRAIGVRRCVLLLGLCATPLLPAIAGAQVLTPTYLSPRAIEINDIGVYFSDGPGDMALEGIWRGGPLGLRVGYVDAAESLLSLGGEYFRAVQFGGEALELLLTAGAQALVGGEGAYGIQVGASAGYTFLPEGVAVTPYLHPRVALLDPLGDPSSFGVEALAEVGVEAGFGNGVLVRLGIGLTDTGADWGIGVALRPGAAMGAPERATRSGRDPVP